ncbi:hypothetical protein [Butyricicoccus faecihominis]|uniref:hypothetical protein n=1 Tax=Butyricicoccus faecihominis TaxID=1712515 RepID=UPI0024788E83|nr:hypothetical protein [Butyricicoccus faecihominis]
MKEQNTNRQGKCTAVCYDNGVVYLVSKQGQSKRFSTKSEAKEYVKAHGGKWKQFRPSCSSGGFGDIAGESETPQPQLDSKTQRRFYRIMTEPPVATEGDWRSILISLSAGYIARMVADLGLESHSSSRNRAPVYRIEADEDGFVRDELERFARMLAPNPIVTGADRSESPTFFPKDYNRDCLESSAYFKMRHTRLPMQYRDTAVIIDQRMLKKKEAERFLDVNPWASVLLIAKKNQKVERSGILPLQLSEVGFPLGKKKTKAMRLVMRAFEQWLQDICRVTTDGKKKHRKYRNQIKAMWRELEPCVKRANVSSRDRFWQKLCLLSADMLVVFILGAFDKLVCPDGSAVSPHDLKQTCQPLWRNLVLLGCCPMVETDVPLEERKEISEADYLEVLRKTVCKMMEDEKRVPYIPRSEEKTICPSCAEDNPEFQYYGYRRWFESKRKERKPAIFFVREEFLLWFEQCSPCACDAKAVLLYCENNAAPTYFAPQKKGARKARIPRALDDNRTKDSVILILDELDFLPDDLRERLLKPFK